MTRTTSVAMTGGTHGRLRELLIRPDGQEDLCLALYRPSTGLTRTSALITEAIPPRPGEREVHGTAGVTADYVLRGCSHAQEAGCGLALLHSHPSAHGWQRMSGPDRDAEAAYANLVRELTGLPLVGMTLAGGDTSWSARHWDHGVGASVAPTESHSVRVIGDRLTVSWNDAALPPPSTSHRQVRTVSAWGERKQADLARRRVLVVGAGSVGLDVVVRLAASGLTHLTIMDFDRVEGRNLDRLIGASRRDAKLRRLKTHVARREAVRSATALAPCITVAKMSICEPDGLLRALDHDLIFSCVDRPWPRAILNALAYSDLIPVIDGGIAIDTLPDATMRNATWRSHVVRPGRPCMSCNRQLDVGQVALDIEGLLDDPEYIAAATREGPAIESGQNVAPLSISVPAALLAQYVSFSVAPGGLGEPGTLQYVLSTHDLQHLDPEMGPHCPYETAEGVGDARIDLTGRHTRAEDARRNESSVPLRIRLLRVVDSALTAISSRLD